MYKIIGANQVEYGPVTAEQLRQWISEGRVNAQTLAQAAGETGWKPISSFPEFAASFPSGPAPSPAGTFAPAPLGAPISPDEGRARAMDAASAPAIGLIVTAALGIAVSGLGIIGNLTGMATSQLQQFQNLPGFQGAQNQQLMHMMQMTSGSLGIAFNVFKIAAAVFIIFAALKMKQLQNYGMAMAASIIALLPCISPCCCVGLPIGIWALIVLSRADVKSYFS